MKQEKILNTIINKLQALPGSELLEVYDFIQFLINKSDNERLTHAIQQQASQSESFAFLEDEEDVTKYNQWLCKKEILYWCPSRLPICLQQKASGHGIGYHR